MDHKQELEKEYQHLLKGLSFQRRKNFDKKKFLKDLIEAQRLEKGDGSAEKLKHCLERDKDFNDDDPSLDKLIQVFSRELEKQLKSLYPSFNEPVIVHCFPEGEYNASAKRIDHGILILINHGMMMLIHQTMMLIGYAVRMDDSDRYILPREQVVKLIAQTLSHYIFQGQSVKAKRPPPVLGKKGYLLAGVRRECERFLMAHEYGHLISRHLKRHAGICHGDGKYDTGGPNAFHEEYIADQTGLELLLNENKDYVPQKGKFELEIREKIAGTFMFFSVAHLIKKADSILQGRPRRPCAPDTHPSIGLRIQNLKNVIYKKYRKEHVDASLFWTNVLDDLTPDILRYLDR